MALYLLRRVGSLLFVLLGLTLIMFLLQSASQSDPARVILGERADAASVDALRAQLGLDQPLPMQYVHYLGTLLDGSFGISYRTRTAVGPELFSRFPATIELGAFALLWALLFGVVYAITTLRRNPVGAAFRGFVLSAAAAPSFLLGILAILLFYRTLGWLPANGRGGSGSGFVIVESLFTGQWGEFGDALRHVLLPSLCIGLGSALVIGRLFASSISSTLQYDYVRTAVAKGLTGPQVVGRHVVRNASNPLLSVVGLQVGAMLAGTLVVELIFNWPGLGLYLSEAIGTSDFPAVAAVTVILAVGYVIVNTAVEVIQGVVDPRLRVA
jgi:peptide/nickel transport system permease protein